MPKTVSAFCSPFWELEESHRDSAVHKWIDTGKRKSDIAGDFREGVGQSWIKQLFKHWDFKDYDGVELARELGVDNGTASRMKNPDRCSTKVGSIAMLACRRGCVFPPFDLAECGCAAIAYSLPRCLWHDKLVKTRPSRTAVDPRLSCSEVCLLLSLDTPNTVLRWHRTTKKYQQDLLAATNDREFAKLIDSLTERYRQIMSLMPSHLSEGSTYFREAKPSQTSLTILCQDMNHLWQQYHMLWQCLKEVVGHFLPWMHIAL